MFAVAVLVTCATRLAADGPSIVCVLLVLAIARMLPAVLQLRVRFSEWLARLAAVLWRGGNLPRPLQSCAATAVRMPATPSRNLAVNGARLRLALLILTQVRTHITIVEWVCHNRTRARALATTTTAGARIP